MFVGSTGTVAPRGVLRKEFHPGWVPEVGWMEVDHFVFAKLFFTAMVNLPKFYCNPERKLLLSTECNPGV